MPGIFRFWQLRKSPRWHSRQVPSRPPCQPTPTRCPFFHAETPAPTSSTVPATSCPGMRGYWMPGHKPSFVSTSLWQTPQACTLMRTCPKSGSGISRLTISKSPPGLEICATFIGATSGFAATLSVAINPPDNFVTVVEKQWLSPARQVDTHTSYPATSRSLRVRPAYRAEGLRRRTPIGKDSFPFRKRFAAIRTRRQRLSADRGHLHSCYGYAEPDDASHSIE